MKKISIVILILLTSCNALTKHADDLKPIAHDMVDEEIDDCLSPQKHK